jgi:hypothetical protein
MQYHRKAAVEAQTNVQKRVDDCREDERKLSADREAASKLGPREQRIYDPEKQQHIKLQAEEKKIDSSETEQSKPAKRQATEEECKRLKCVVGEPIFIDEKDIPKNATVIDLTGKL